jgi:hypothetical protein
MRTTTKVLAVLVAAASTATLGGLWGSTISARAEAPVRARDAAPDPAATRAPLVVAADVLPGGLALPAGVRPLGAPRAGESTSDLHRWETDLELGAVPGADALAALRRDLTADGFELRGGTADVFAMRQRDGRWEIVVARVDTRGVAGASREVLTLGIGSRPA